MDEEGEEVGETKTAAAPGSVGRCDGGGVWWWTKKDLKVVTHSVSRPRSSEAAVRNDIATVPPLR